MSKQENVSSLPVLPCEGSRPRFRYNGRWQSSCVADVWLPLLHSNGSKYTRVWGGCSRLLGSVANKGRRHLARRSWSCIETKRADKYCPILGCKARFMIHWMPTITHQAFFRENNLKRTGEKDRGHIHMKTIKIPIGPVPLYSVKLGATSQTITI